MSEYKGTSWGVLAVWSLDFIRAIWSRGVLAKVLFRISLGKYAYREFIGMMDAFEREGFSPYYGYDLENQQYHKDKIPFVNWWSEREPMPMRDISESDFFDTEDG